MTLDERLRDELRHAVEANELREDEALDHVQLQHGRGLVRKGVVRQATAVAVVLSLSAAAAIVVSWRNAPDASLGGAPDSFRSTATLRVAPAATSGSTSTTIARAFKLADPRTLALAPSTRRAALLSARLSPDDSNIDFRATLNPTKDLLSLTVTAPSGREATAVARYWGSAFVKARRAEAIRLLRATNLALDRRVTALHQELQAVDAQLKRIDPISYGNLKYNPPNSYPFGAFDPGPTKVRAPATVAELNLWNERVQILTALADAGADAARTRIVQLGPHAFATVVAQTPAVRVDQTPPAAVPALIGWVLGLVVVFAGALFTYRRRTRSRQVST